MNSESLASLICSSSQSVDDISCLYFPLLQISLSRVLEDGAKPSLLELLESGLLPKIMLSVSPKSRRVIIRSTNGDTGWTGRQGDYEHRH